MVKIDPVKAKFKFTVSLVFLIAGIIYAIFPLDLIPDFLGPIGWVDDIGILFMTLTYSLISYRKMKKEEARASQSRNENILP